MAYTAPIDTPSKDRKAARVAKALVCGTPMVAGVSALVLGGAAPAYAGQTQNRTDHVTFRRFSTNTQISCSIANHIEAPPYHNEPHLAFASIKISGPAGCSGQITLTATWTQPDLNGGRAVLSKSGTKLEDEFAPVLRDFGLTPQVTFVDCVQSPTNNCSYQGMLLTTP